MQMPGNGSLSCRSVASFDIRFDRRKLTPAGGIAGGSNLRYCRGAMNGLRNAGRARIPRDDMAPLARIGSSAAPGEMVIRWLIRS
jgi:hypothetical protein